MKRLIIFIILFAISSFLFAQYSVGIKASPIIYGSWNYTTGNINDNTDVSKFTWAPINAGAFFNYTFKENFALQTEIKPMVEGLSCTITDSDTEGGWFSFTYIETPFLFQYKGKTRFRGFAEAGIALKFLVLADHNYYESDSEQKYDAKNYFNPIVLKGNVGGGIMFDVTKSFTLIADTRLGYDFTPIGKKSVVEKMGKEWSFDAIRLLHLTIISFGVAFNF